jgi:hypothetical protein
MLARLRAGPPELTGRLARLQQRMAAEMAPAPVGALRAGTIAGHGPPPLIVDMLTDVVPTGPPVAPRPQFAGWRLAA